MGEEVSQQSSWTDEKRWYFTWRSRGYVHLRYWLWLSPELALKINPSGKYSKAVKRSQWGTSPQLAPWLSPPGVLPKKKLYKNILGNLSSLTFFYGTGFKILLKKCILINQFHIRLNWVTLQQAEGTPGMLHFSHLQASKKMTSKLMNLNSGSH